MQEVKGAIEGKAMFEEANRLNLEGKLDEAASLYDAMLTQNPDNAGLLATMGTVLMKQGKTGLAITLLHRAAQKTPASDILSNLGLAYKYSGQHEKALEYMNKALKDDPSAETLNSYAGMHINVGTPDISLKYADKALELRPEYEMAHWNKSISLLELGRWNEAWDEHEHGFTAHMRIRRNIDDKPYWDGTEGKTIAVYGEQGLGDEIMFASMLPDLMAKNNVILECHPRLKTLFEKAFPGTPIYGTRDQKEINWHNGHEIDYSVSIGSLGKWYRRSRESFPGTPYLKADPLPRDEKFRVGISWTGGLKQGRVAVRSIPLAWWRPILDMPNVDFVSLQYTDADAEIDVANSNGYDIKKAPEAKAHDYYETARLVASCDLVISCCTSVVHLAGALGVPCWVMVPNKPAWRYGVSGGMPWYRSVRLYRQPQGDVSAWKPVVERVAFDLSEHLGARQQRVA